MNLVTTVEEWRPVVGFEGWYSISSLGRLRRDAKGGSTSPGRIRITTTTNKYESVILCRHAKRYSVLIHALVAAAFIGPRPNGYQVNHKNGDRKDNRAVNLEYVTPRENSQHAARTGLSPAGESHYAARLTGSQVTEIRTSYAAGTHTQTALAAQYGVGQPQISAIVRGTRWPRLNTSLIN